MRLIEPGVEAVGLEGRECSEGAEPRREAAVPLMDVLGVFDAGAELPFGVALDALAHGVVVAPEGGIALGAHPARVGIVFAPETVVHKAVHGLGHIGEVRWAVRSD